MFGVLHVNCISVDSVLWDQSVLVAILNLHCQPRKIIARHLHHLLVTLDLLHQDSDDIWMIMGIRTRYPAVWEVLAVIINGLARAVHEQTGHKGMGSLEETLMRLHASSVANVDIMQTCVRIKMCRGTVVGSKSEEIGFQRSD